MSDEKIVEEKVEEKPLIAEKPIVEHPFKKELMDAKIQVGLLSRDNTLDGISVDKEFFMKVARLSNLACHMDKPDQEIYGKKFGDVTYKDSELYMTVWAGLPVYYIALNE